MTDHVEAGICSSHMFLMSPDLPLKVTPPWKRGAGVGRSGTAGSRQLEDRSKARWMNQPQKTFRCTFSCSWQTISREAAARLPVGSLAKTGAFRVIWSRVGISHASQLGGLKQNGLLPIAVGPYEDGFAGLILSRLLSVFQRRQHHTDHFPPIPLSCNSSLSWQFIFLFMTFLSLSILNM